MSLSKVIILKQHCENNIKTAEYNTAKYTHYSIYRCHTREPSWRKGKRATAVREWKPLAKKSTLQQINARNIPK